MHLGLSFEADMIAIDAIKQQIKRKENAFNPPNPTKLENLKSSFVENICENKSHFNSNKLNYKLGTIIKIIIPKFLLEFWI